MDAIAVLAPAGSLTVREYFAGALIGVMLATGRSLESFARRPARRDLRALLERAPRLAHRRDADAVRRVPIGDVRRGELLLVPAGEIVPVDGVVQHGLALLDESALTGEALPAEYAPGARVRSGTVNAGDVFDLRATGSAAESTYAGVERLARQATGETAPIVRLADRLAAVFLPLTLIVAAVAWVASGRLVRAVAVLVVATPCTLLLAAPVAIVAGLSRTARCGVVVKGGFVREQEPVTAMVGDGLNDAPALADADVAMGPVAPPSPPRRPAS